MQPNQPQDCLSPKQQPKQQAVGDFNPINNVPYSLFPTQFFYLRRLVNINDLNPKPDLSKAVVSNDFVELYINPRSLQYPLIDSILNFGEKLNNVKLEFSPFEKVREDMEIYTAQFKGDIEKLLELHNLNFYEPRFEEGSYRGGRRFLFRSEDFAKELKKALDMSLTGLNFKAINNVFRYNCFEPKDQPFYEHYDVPYVDMTRKKISQYTIIIYLTEGQNDTPVLQIADVKFNKLSAGQCVIFHHKYSHKGISYKTGNKLFIRSELIFKYSHKPEVFSEEAAKWFNRACYLTKQSILDSSLKSYSNRCFQQFCRNRYKLSGDSPHLFLHKKPTVLANDCKLQNLEYITDGNDYYFSDKVRIAVAAGVVVWDYFASAAAGSFVKDKYYIQEGMDYQGMFDRYLSKYCVNPGQIPQLSCLKILQNNHLTLGSQSLPKNMSQPYCNRQSYRPSSQYYPQIFQTLSQSTTSSSLQILQNYLFTLNFSDLIFQDDLIYFKKTNSLRKFNFASCECDPRFREYIELYYGENAGRKQYDLPYMRKRKSRSMWVLNIDMFRNGFITVEMDRKARTFQTEVKVGDIKSCY